MKILLLGASKNVGYYCALRLLSQKHTCIFLLRKTSVFDADKEIQKYLAEGRVKLVKGDGLIHDDVRNLWKVALEDGVAVDYVIFTLGGIPVFGITTGYRISPPNTVTAALINLLSTFPPADSYPHPRLITVLSMGDLHEWRDRMPLMHRILYPLLTAQPHADKTGAEKVISHSAGWGWDSRDIVRPSVLGPGWEKDLPPSGWLKNIVVVLPTLYTNGLCMGDEKGKGAIRAGEVLTGASKISRKDVAWWIVELCMTDWDHWANKRIGVAY